MTEYIPQTSASDRYEAARKALADWWGGVHQGVHPWRNGEALAFALDALITPPGFPLTQVSIDHAADIAEAHGYDSNGVTEAVMEGIEYGIQSAHETWECETALRPTREQMLRWLEIEHSVDEAVGMLFIPAQYIEREDD